MKTITVISAVSVSHVFSHPHTIMKASSSFFPHCAWSCNLNGAEQSKGMFFSMPHGRIRAQANPERERDEGRDQEPPLSAVFASSKAVCTQMFINCRGYEMLDGWIPVSLNCQSNGCYTVVPMDDRNDILSLVVWTKRLVSQFHKAYFWLAECMLTHSNCCLTTGAYPDVGVSKSPR